MSIKIDGTKNKEKIFKEKDGSEVRIIPSLFLNGTEITASGGGGTDPGVTEKVCEIKDCGTYAASQYADYDKVKVNVSNWETVENIPDNYYEINSNWEYSVSKFAGYAGIVVTNASEPDPEPEPEITTEVFDVSFSESSYQTEFVSTKVKDLSSSANKTSLKSFEIYYSGQFNLGDILSSDSASYTFRIPDFNEPVITKGLEISLNYNGKIYGYNVDVTWSAAINSQNQIVITATEIKSTQKPSTDTPTDFRAKFWIPTQTTQVTQTFITYPDSSWSLRSTNSIPQPAIYKNLVVNNDALIQGNLSVNGYINDLLWYWDSSAINAIETDLGTGFLAKITDLTFKLNNEQVLVPTLQLSPGSSYKESNYSIIWTSTGALKIDADDITEISGSIQILRYA